MEKNAKIGPWTHGRNLTPLQSAATELLPHGFSIPLGIRELVRQGYLISAEILLRPLIERAAVIGYLCETLIYVRRQVRCLFGRLAGLINRDLPSTRCSLQ